MYAYKEILIIDDPRRLTLTQASPLRKGQQVEVLVLVQDEDADLRRIRDSVTARGIREEDVDEAIAWARSSL
jgi:hypothetical protein